MLLGESEGSFSYEEWNEACQMAEEACCGEHVDHDEEEEEEEEGGIRLDVEGDAMDIDAQIEAENLDKWLRSVVKSKVEHEQRWRSAT